MVCAVAGTASYQRLSPVSQRGPPACPPEPPLPRLAVPPVHARPVRLRDSGQRTHSFPAAVRCRMFIFFF